MGIHTFLFGHTSSGEPVFARTVGNRNGMRMTVLDYGATIQSLCVPDRNGVMRDIVCGYDDVYGYEKDTTYCGAIVGRWANRIGKGAFSLDGKSYTLACNNGENHLHGGSVGYSHRIWACREEGEDTLSFALDSPDGEEGYPGHLAYHGDVPADRGQRTFHPLFCTGGIQKRHQSDQSYLLQSGRFRIGRRPASAAPSGRRRLSAHRRRIDSDRGDCLRHRYAV